eukprot:TRINITY_DN7970_c1_g2_i2.p1 TRINITY_DN7970_c1_g2~~TRINITY_DN7970_c1_g2_i2.p1  ORF type:complete len:623 (+),score=92.60 TRINITY_DN7970_c1_g2_i2:41-1909(+)
MELDSSELSSVKENPSRVVDEIKQLLAPEIQEVKSLLLQILDTQRGLVAGRGVRATPTWQDKANQLWLVRGGSQSKPDHKKPAAVGCLEEQLAKHMLGDIQEAVFRRSTSDPCLESDAPSQQVPPEQPLRSSSCPAHQLPNALGRLPNVLGRPQTLGEGESSGEVGALRHPVRRHTSEQSRQNSAPPRPLSPRSAPAAPSEALPILPLPHSLRDASRDMMAIDSSTTFARQRSNLDTLRQVHETSRVKRCEEMIDTTLGAQPVEEQLRRCEKLVLATSHKLLGLTGIMPLSSGWSGYVYPAVLIVCCTCVSAVFAQKAFFGSQPLGDSVRALEVLGAGLALLIFHLQGASKLFIPHKNPLYAYAIARNIFSSWVSRIAVDAILPALSFLLALSPLLLPGLSGCDDFLKHEKATHTFLQLTSARTLSGLLLTAIWYCTHHMCSFMSLAVDEFAHQQFGCGGDAELGVVQWNLVQAMLNQAAKRLEGTLMVTITVSGICLIPAAADFLQVVEAESSDGHFFCHPMPQGLATVLLRLAMSLYTVYKAAEVTEKCNRSICFINSLQRDSGPILDEQRSFLVRHMADSSAGFHIRGVKITSLIFLKLLYGTGALVAAICVQAARSNG